tara:strand:+ start:3146 stop:4525 length:1380 start_codon:yes stop_codon:yes gene_type:complete
MQFLAPTNIFEGVVQLNQAPSADNHAVTRSYLEANSVVGIASDSANYAELVTEGGDLKLKLKPLTITDVAVDTTATSLANWISGNYTGSEKQEGDIIILTGVSGRAETWINNGGTGNNAGDWTEIEGQDIQASEVRSFISGSAGIDYNSGTGAITADQGEIRAFFSAGSGLGYDAANGAFSLTANTDGIGEGSSNLYFTNARARSAVSVTGSGLAYNSGTGAISLTADSDVIGEGSSNLYFTNARARGAVSLGAVAGPDVQLLEYDSGAGELKVKLSSVRSGFSAGVGLSYSSGVYALNATTQNVSEHSSNLYFTDARARAAISVDTAGLAYNSGTGQIALDANTSQISEDASALFFTNARARAAVSADASANNLLQYNGSNGELLVDINKFRAELAPTNLTANTFTTITHNLGKKFVHVSCYDSNDKLVQVEVELISTTQCKVKSVINVSGAAIIASL